LTADFILVTLRRSVTTSTQTSFHGTYLDGTSPANLEGFDPNSRIFTSIFEFAWKSVGEIPDGICKDMAEPILRFFLFLMVFVQKNQVKTGL